jgi:hypothetical protein
MFVFNDSHLECSGLRRTFQCSESSYFYMEKNRRGWKRLLWRNLFISETRQKENIKKSHVCTERHFSFPSFNYIVWVNSWRWLMSSGFDDFAFAAAIVLVVYRFSESESWRCMCSATMKRCEKSSEQYFQARPQGNLCDCLCKRHVCHDDNNIGTLHCEGGCNIFCHRDKATTNGERHCWDTKRLNAWKQRGWHFYLEEMSTDLGSSALITKDPDDAPLRPDTGGCRVEEVP